MSQLRIFAAVVAAAGIILAFLGGYRIVTHLPVTQEDIQKQSQETDKGGDSVGEALGRAIVGALDAQTAQLRAQLENDQRAKQRESAKEMAIPGVALLVVGLGVMLWAGRRPQ